jgi:predicted phosphoribosyltransferase
MGTIVEERNYRDKRFVFEDRTDAGRKLTNYLHSYEGTDAIVLAIPSGGVPVGAEIAKGFGLPIDVIIVRKLQIPFEPEAGFGAVDLDGGTTLNDDLMTALELTADDVERAKKEALDAAHSRDRALRGGRAFPSLSGKVVILVDDGLASGYTMLAAIKRVKTDGPQKIIVAVPTGSKDTALMIAEEVDELVCLNIRSPPFAVADAYENWYDLTEEEALKVLRTVA